MLAKAVKTQGTYLTQTNDFKQPCVRDLAWVIASPPLVSGSFNQARWWNRQQCLKEFHDCLPALQALDKKPQPLIDHLNLIKSKRLGLYFEGLVSFWLSFISPNYRLLAHNIQLFETLEKGKHTLGEIDFIIQEIKTAKTIHLEVAVKFYLGTVPLEDTYHWFGTNTKDQLGRKLDHLKQLQTQLSKIHPELLDFNIDERHCLLKGRLFYPQGLDQAPAGISKAHLRGRWLYASQNCHDQLLIPLDKNNWLAELNHAEIKQQLAKQAPNKLFNNEPARATCYSITAKDKREKYRELERLFILPDDFTFPIKKP